MLRFASLLALPLLLSGCMYSFTGGGLPGHIGTVAVLPFENSTSQPLLETDIERALQAELPRRLGVRLAAEDRADAVIRGSITQYDETAASVRPTQEGDLNQVPVVQRQVRLVYEAEIYDVGMDEPIWRAQSQSVVGNYQPDQETPTAARARAIEELVRKIIEGAQSQW